MFYIFTRLLKAVRIHRWQICLKNNNNKIYLQKIDMQYVLFEIIVAPMFSRLKTLNTSYFYCVKLLLVILIIYVLNST